MKEKVRQVLREAARKAAELTATYAPRFFAYVPIVYAAKGSGLTGIANDLAAGAQGLAILGGVVGAILLGAGALLRYLPGTSADMRQTAIKMMEGGFILLAIIGSGALILYGANWIGRTLAEGFGAQNTQVDQTYLNPWNLGSGGSSGGSSGG